MAEPIKHSGSDIEFQADPSLLLAPFDIYDREESLGQELAAYDPTIPSSCCSCSIAISFPAVSRLHGALRIK
ncbi:hypothetical protein Cthiooxydans_27800 [Comamonas thiooxydans]|nr:hypothetical protein Cthiooxydans_27800 [Comamonas thiooxydans]